MENPIFRKKSLDRISSPEALDDYLHVTTPAVWMILAARDARIYDAVIARQGGFGEKLAESGKVLKFEKELDD